MYSGNILEVFESRRLLSVLTVNGTMGDDTIEVALVGSDVQVTVNGGPQVSIEAAAVTGISLYGAQGNDLITMLTNIPATIRGGLGNDTIMAGAGNDEIYGGEGNDVIHAGAGNDTVYAKDNDDDVYGDDGNDLLYGNGKNDTLRGGDGSDTIYGNAGNDRMFGEGKSDLMFGGIGNDTLTGGAGDDNLFGGDEVVDTLFASDGDDVLDTVDDPILFLDLGDGGTGTNTAYKDEVDDVINCVIA